MDFTSLVLWVILVIMEECNSPAKICEGPIVNP